MDIIKNKKYIEEKFPIAEVNRICVSERIALKPIYMMHRVFARRIGSVFRVIILGALKDKDADIMQEFYKSHKNDPDTNGVVILDPMCGGGTTLVEGSRLGADVIGFEINPIPWFVTKCELTKVDIDALKAAFEIIEERAGKKIKNMYQTHCPYCKKRADVIYVFWIKKVFCPECKREIKLFKDFIITYDKAETNFHLVCPNCMNVFKKEGKPEEVEKCPCCNNEFRPYDGVVFKNSITCPGCKHNFKLIDVLKSLDSPLDAEPYAIDGWCWHCHRRFIKNFDHTDKKILLKSEMEFDKSKDVLLYPKEKIPDGYNTNQMKKHNYNYWYQMFNKRQILALSILLEEIRNIPDNKIREILLLAFSECLRSNNMFCYYDKKWAKQNTPLFSRKDFAPVNFPLEQNVWGSRYGRGSFIQVFQRVLKGKEYNLHPFERQYTTKGVKRINIDEVVGDTQWEVYCLDAQKLDGVVKDAVDLVITDPPYFDSINYSEVYDFFYVWLKKVLEYPCFSKETTYDPNEAIVNKVQNKSSCHFKKIVTNIFKKSANVLKKDGLFIFTFHDINIDSWKNMLEIVNNAGLSVVKVHIYHGENVSAKHYGGQKSVFDSIWVCKKGNSKHPKKELSAGDAVQKILKEVQITVNEIKKSKFFKLDEDDVKIIIYGKTVEVLSKYNVAESYTDIVECVLRNHNTTKILKNLKRAVLITDFVDK